MSPGHVLEQGCRTVHSRSPISSTRKYGFLLQTGQAWQGQQSECSSQPGQHSISSGLPGKEAGGGSFFIAVTAGEGLVTLFCILDCSAWCSTGFVYLCPQYARIVCLRTVDVKYKVDLRHLLEIFGVYNDSYYYCIFGWSQCKLVFFLFLPQFAVAWSAFPISEDNLYLWIWHGGVMVTIATEFSIFSTLPAQSNFNTSGQSLIFTTYSALFFQIWLRRHSLPSIPSAAKSLTWNTFFSKEICGHI